MSGQNKKQYHALQVPSCPCGGHVVINDSLRYKRGNYFPSCWLSSRYSVECTSCGDNAFAWTKKEAIEQFNRLHEVEVNR